MDENKTGGPAFPSETSTRYFLGMTLRDYFAVKAMQGICASGPGHHMTNDLIAKEAYSLADAMIHERHKP